MGITLIPLIVSVFFKKRLAISCLLTSVNVLLCAIKIEILQKARDENIMDKNINLMLFPFICNLKKMSISLLLLNKS
jgi:hypothetical protein